MNALDQWLQLIEYRCRIKGCRARLVARRIYSGTETACHGCGEPHVIPSLTRTQRQALAASGLVLVYIYGSLALELDLPGKVAGKVRDLVIGPPIRRGMPVEAPKPLKVKFPPLTLT